jgi:large subunit ribosomal protein L18
MNNKHKVAQRRRKALRVRRALGSSGTRYAPRPRLSVFRSLNNVYAQVIDDVQGRTLAAASTQDKALRDACKGMNKSDAAKKVGELLAQRAKDAGVSKVAFDRGRFKFHGRVKALADAAREGGLEF